MLNAVVNETEHMVKTAIAQFIGILVKHEFPTNTWPELLQFIQQLCESEAENNKELGMFTISVMVDMAPGQYIPHINALCQLCSAQLESIRPESNVTIPHYALVTLTKLIPVVEGHDAVSISINLLSILLFFQDTQQIYCSCNVKNEKNLLLHRFLTLSSIPLL